MSLIECKWILGEESVADLHWSKEWYCKTFRLRVIQESDQSVLLGFGENMLVPGSDATARTVPHFMLGVDHFHAASTD
jgi:hypothetical protein